MLKLKFTSGTTLKDWINAISAVALEGPLKYSKETGISVRAMDPGQIAMVDFRVPEDACAELSFEAGKEEEMVTVPFDELKKLCTRLKADDRVELTIDKNITLKAIGGDSTRTWNVGLISADKEMGKMPSIEFTSTATLEASKLVSMLDDLKILTEYVRFSLDKQMTLLSLGDSGSLTIEAGDVAKVESSESASSNFALEFLLVFAKAARGDIKMQFRTESPLLMSFNVDGADVAYFLAPRIDSD